MLNLIATSDKIQLISSSAAPLHVHCSYVDLAAGVSTPSRDNTVISSATTTDIIGSPAASTVRNVKSINVRNTDASLTCDVTIFYEGSGTDVDVELFKGTLYPQEVLVYNDMLGTWYIIPRTAKLLANKRVTTDYVNATTSFSDITGLTVPVEAGKNYCFEAHLFHRSDATTSGSQFGINGPAMTLMTLNAIQQITASVTAATIGASAAVTALDTAAVVETTGPGTNTFLAILSGFVNFSAAGTFAVRGKSEVAVAAGLTVKAGSWLQLWETDN